MSVVKTTYICIKIQIQLRVSAIYLVIVKLRIIIGKITFYICIFILERISNVDIKFCFYILIYILMMARQTVETRSWICIAQVVFD